MKPRIMCSKKMMGITIGFASGLILAVIAPFGEDVIQPLRPNFVVSIETNPIVGVILFPPLFGLLGALSTSDKEESTA